MREIKCPKCNNLMERKGMISSDTCEEGCCESGYELYQCEKCKNVEIT